MQVLDEYLPVFERIDLHPYTRMYILGAAHPYLLRLDAEHPTTREFEETLAAAYRIEMAAYPQDAERWVGGIQTARANAEAASIRERLEREFEIRLQAAGNLDEILTVADAMNDRFEDAKQRYSVGYRFGRVYDSALYHAYSIVEQGPATAALEERVRTYSGEQGLQQVRNRVAKERKRREKRAR